MAVVQRKVPAPPDQIMMVQSAPRAYQILKAAMELNVFEAMEHAAKTAEDIAKELNIDARGTECLLNALVGLNFIQRKENKYDLLEISRVYLLQSSDLFMGLYLKHAEQLDKGWSQLGSAVRSGKPIKEVNTQQTAEEFFPALAEGIFPMSYATAQVVARDLADVNHGSARILDVAAGSGVWSIPFAEANQSATVDALDFPSVLEVTKKITAKRGLKNQYNFLSGDWRSIEWKDEMYDIIVLGHILHSEGKAESIKLLKQCFKSLKPDGVVVVAEFLCNEKRTGPSAALIFELNMFLHTTDGCVFSVDELKKLMHDCGFKHVDYSADINEQPVLVGSKT
ncbi:MAG TPA: class I SAM-dependent methyltransferase [Drouetiella sp.]